MQVQLANHDPPPISYLRSPTTALAMAHAAAHGGPMGMRMGLGRMGLRLAWPMPGQRGSGVNGKPKRAF